MLDNESTTVDRNELQAVVDPNADWEKEMAEFITPTVIADVQAQLALCDKILNSPIFQNVPFGVYALGDAGPLSDVSVNGEWVAKMAEAWAEKALASLEATKAGDALSRFDGCLEGSFDGSGRDQELLRIVRGTLREAVVCYVALGMLAGFEHANRRMQSATENLRKAVVDAKLVAA
jgi:hypothetical protein